MRFFSRENLPKHELKDLTRDGYSVFKRWLKVLNPMDVVTWSIDGEIVGWCGVIDCKDFESIPIGRAYGIGCFVNEKCRGKGIADKLIKKALHRLAKRQPDARVLYAGEDWFNSYYYREIAKAGLTPRLYWSFCCSKDVE